MVSCNLGFAPQIVLFDKRQLLQPLNHLFRQPLVAHEPTSSRFALTSEKGDCFERLPLRPGKALYSID